MEELIIRPSLRRVKLGLALALIILGAIVFIYVRYRENLAWWVLLVGLLPFIAPVAGWLDHKRLELHVGGESLRARLGLFGKEMRAIPFARIARVSVERSFAQRLYGVGTVIIEGSGPGERIVAGEIDAPKRVARQISEAAKLAGAAAAVRGMTGKENSDDE
jgi:uncharacterized membrane protein YdbT with pleckstrin-like domain